jgi:hypothetical protein
VDSNFFLEASLLPVLAGPSYFFFLFANTRLDTGQDDESKVAEGWAT